MPNNTLSQRRALLPLGLKILHWVIIVNFALNIFYAAYMVFVGMAPDGHLGPLWSAAKTMDPEQLIIRRLYAIEFWISTVGLAIYLALTEYLPRLLAPLIPSLVSKLLARAGEGVDA